MIDYENCRCADKNKAECAKAGDDIYAFAGGRNDEISAGKPSEGKDQE